MTPYRRLLCPVDFSDVSRRALEWSAGFAEEVGANLTVLHVVDEKLLGMGNLVAVPDGLAELRERAEEQWVSWKHEIDLSKAQLEIVDGVPEQAIVTAASAPGVDLVAMGTHGLSGFQKLLLGSVTEKVLHRLHSPLLVISAEGKGERRAPLRPRTIVMAIDFGDESQSVVRHGVWLAEHYRAKLLAVHVVPVPYVVLNERTVERLSPDELARLESSLTAERRKQLERLLPETAGVDVEIVSRVGSPFELLRDLVRERAADLVVMGAGGHGESGISWLGSTCHKIVRSAECPVLIVR